VYFAPGDFDVANENQMRHWAAWMIKTSWQIKSASFLGLIKNLAPVPEVNMGSI